MSDLEELEEPSGPHNEFVDQHVDYGRIHQVQAEGSGSSSGGKEVTREMILRTIERQTNTKRPSKVTDSDAEDKYLAKQSHLHLNGMGLTKISGLRCVPKIEVLYLYDNAITQIENVHVLRNLKLLYLQNNSITHITGLEELKGLQKLYLDNNCIQVVSGLHACTNLEELHLSNQRLPPGMGMEFHPASVAAISRTLRILGAINCSITNEVLDQLFVLSRLRRLDLANNHIDNFEALEAMLRPLPNLQSLDLRGNPICKLPKYRDSVVLMNDTFTTLDDEPISQKQREFLLRFQLHKMKAALQAEAKELGLAEGDGGAGTSAAPAAAHNQHLVPPTHPLGPPQRLPPRPGGFNNHMAIPGAAKNAPGNGKLSRNNSGRKASDNGLGLELGGVQIR